jgi:SH3-like domain-containing protein
MTGRPMISSRWLGWSVALALAAAPLAAGAEVRPQPRPALPQPTEAALEAAPPLAAPADPAAVQTVAAKPGPPRDPNRGSVTNLPLPRYVSLKTNEGNARRGPGRTHRIDWVFTRAGMPLRITAEFEHWRRVEDAEGVGGWVHYSLLSGIRTVLVAQDMAEFRTLPDANAPVALQAEMGVVARVVSCEPDWCRLSVDGARGWVRKDALWGVEPGEIID